MHAYEFTAAIPVMQRPRKTASFAAGSGRKSEVACFHLSVYLVLGI